MRRSSAPALLLALALTLAACAPRLPLGPTVTAPVAGLAAQGEADLVVRTFLVTADGARAEVGGAVCEVSSLLFAVRLTTPARLVVPSFGPQSVTLDVACRAETRTGAARQGVVTRWRPAPGGWGWAGGYPGVAGPWPGGPYGGWGVGWSSGWGGGYPEFIYPDVHVVLE